MRYSFRLAELIGHDPNPKKRPGTIKSIVEYTGLDRHQVAALLRNEVKYIPLKALSRLCDYLIDNGHATADQLPGALFAIEPENFWELLARRRRLELCLGVRRDDEFKDAAWVMASDSVLLGELLNGVSTLGGTAKHRRSEEGKRSGESPVPQHPEHIKQSLVWSPGQGTDEEVHKHAIRRYEEFTQSGGDKALICLGSIKSNPVVELILARAFSCEAFQSQDDCQRASERRCPFLLRYRDYDPHPDSCSGGLRLSRSETADQPGIYFEQSDGAWSVCPWSEEELDVALVFYIHREAQGWLEMVLGGFSGRATRQLAKTLATHAEEFWPPNYDSQGVQVGAFIVQYTFDPHDEKDQGILSTEQVASAKVFPLTSEAIGRRLNDPAAGASGADA